MKTFAIFTIAFVLFSLEGFNQERGTFGKDGFFLRGKMEIHMKNKEIIKDSFNIDNTKISNSDIDYRNIDYIIKDDSRYEYVRIEKNKIQLLKINSTIEVGIKFGVIQEGRKVVFYESIPKWQPKANTTMGTYSEVSKVNYFMLKKGMTQAVKYKSWEIAGLVKKYFTDCPQLMNILKNKEKREKLTPLDVYDIYNNNCTNLEEGEK